MLRYFFYKINTKSFRIGVIFYYEKSVSFGYKCFLWLVGSVVCCLSILGITLNAEADEVGDLFNYYMKKVSSGVVNMTISEQPDSTGFFKDVYLEAKDVVIENVRIDAVSASVSGLQLNPPSEWSQTEYVEYGPDGSIIRRGGSDKPNVKFYSFQSGSLNVNISENSINNVLKDRNFSFNADGKSFTLSSVSVSITTDGIKISGYLKENGTADLRSYAAAWLLGAAADNYPVEVNSKLKIVDGKEIWLDNPTVTKGKFSQLDSYIEKHITKRNEPIFDLSKKLDLSKIPVTLGKIELNNGSLSPSTNTLPKALVGGIKYTNSTVNNDGEQNTNNEPTNNNGDEQNTNNEPTNNNEIKRSSSSSSGCSSGVGAFGALTFIILASVFFKKH